ncbi:cysteine dioxygenase family protein [Krasilnikovia sp. M28-CT-15]
MWNPSRGVAMTSASRIDCLAIAHRFAAEPYDWPVAPRFRPGKRWSVRLLDRPDYEVWLTTWLPGQGTSFHAHDGGGAVHVMRGELIELVQPDDDGEPAAIHMLRSGFGRLLTPGRHRIVNQRPFVAVSVHVLAGRA